MTPSSPSWSQVRTPNDGHSQARPHPNDADAPTTHSHLTHAGCPRTGGRRQDRCHTPNTTPSLHLRAAHHLLWEVLHRLVPEQHACKPEVDSPHQRGMLLHRDSVLAWHTPCSLSLLPHQRSAGESWGCPSPRASSPSPASPRLPCQDVPLAPVPAWPGDSRSDF